MEIIPFGQFMAQTFGGRPNQMGLAPYSGHPFECACGVRHVFDPLTVTVLRELPGMRLVLACPQGDAVTCVKIKGLFRFKGFASLFGAQSSNSQATSGT